MVKKESKKKVGRPEEWTEKKLEELKKELLEYLKRPDVYHIAHFEVHEKGMVPGWLKSIGTRHPKFRPILRMAQAILGLKIMEMAQQGKGDKFITNTFIPFYLRDIDEYKESIKDKDLDRDLKKEKFKYELGSKKDEEAGAKIDMFDDGAKLAYEVIKLREEIERLKGGA